MPRLGILILLMTGLLWGGGHRQREARQAFERGRKAEQGADYGAAMEAFDEALRQEPGNVFYLTRREVARQHAAMARVSEALKLAEQGRHMEAAREFEMASELDPSNDFVRTQAEQARARTVKPNAAAIGEPPAPAAPPLALRPLPGKRSWDRRGDLRSLYGAIGEAYGIEFIFDDDVPRTTARLRLEDSDFGEVLRAMHALSHTFVTPLDEKTAMVAPDTTAKRVQHERLTIRNIDVAQFTTPEVINEVAQLIRVLLEMRYVVPNLSHKVITVRDSTGKVLAAEQVVRSLSQERGEVLLEIQVLEVDAQRARDLGLLPPEHTDLVRLAPATQKVQTGNAVPLTELLGPAPPISGRTLSSPLAAFGGGKTFFGLTIPPVNFRAVLSDSLLRSYTAVEVRGIDGQPATFLAGSRYPIINASFSAIFLSGQALNQQNSGQLLNPFPSFTFEDLGVKLKFTPKIHAGSEVTLALEMQTRALTGDNLNGVPSISNREYQTQVRLPEGQTAIVTGLLSGDERRSLSGLPGLTSLPGWGAIFGQRSDPNTHSEVLLLITPHVIRSAPADLIASAAIALPADYTPIYARQGMGDTGGK